MLAGWTLSNVPMESKCQNETFSTRGMSLSAFCACSKTPFCLAWPSYANPGPAILISLYCLQVSVTMRSLSSMKSESEVWNWNQSHCCAGVFVLLARFRRRMIILIAPTVKEYFEQNQLAKSYILIKNFAVCHSRNLITVFTGAFWMTMDAMFLRVNEDSDYTAQMRKPIWVFVGRSFYTLRLIWGHKFNTRQNI